jgi:hypothetical protein
MHIVEVNDKKSKKLFLNVVKKIYKEDKSYVRPLNKEIESTFNPKTNPFFNHGKAVRYILIDNSHKVIGRIAAFINDKKTFGFDQPTGGIGFFECINDQEAAFKLFSSAEKWLSNKGMEAADGPINFGENDNFWGLLVDGFSSPSYGMQYNPPYYQKLYEAYGFDTYFEQITNRLDLTKPFPERFWKIAEWIGKKPNYKFEHFTWKEKDKFIDDFIEIYNDAWRFHENFVPINKQKIESSFNKTKPILIEDLLWFAYYKGEPIGFLIMYPDVNQILKHFNGKLHFFNQLRFLIFKLMKKMTRTRVIILGIKPKYQKSGVESGMFYHLRQPIYNRSWIKEMELSWVGDFNPKMRSLQDSMGAEYSKKHITYRLIFDPQKRKHTRASKIPEDTKEQFLKSQPLTKNNKETKVNDLNIRQIN